MNRTVLVVSLVLLISAPLFAQSGRISLYGDPSGTDCAVFPNVGEVVNVYVFHVNTLGATGSQFSAPNPACSQWTYLNDFWVFDITLGNSQTGVAVLYGTCRTGTFLLMRISYYASGQSDPCCYYPILPDPREPGDILGVDCQFEVHPMSGSAAIINPNATCDCTIP
jgi:hypothetical protein